MTVAVWIRAIFLICVILTLGFAEMAEAQRVTISFLIGKKDGFGGTQKCNPCVAGDPFSVFSSAVILPGTYVNRGFDATTVDPTKPYVFEFDFKYDASEFSRITNATVVIRSGNVARRSTENNGFGFATVTAEGGRGPISLGQFWTASTGLRASAQEESVKDHKFNVLPAISKSGTLKFVIDGSGLADPSDQFSLDYAELRIQGIERPIGSTVLARTIN
jgi:hypothetical protein